MSTVEEKGMADAAKRPSRVVTPLLTICCVCFCLFLAAATVALALIPVYLARRNLAAGNARASQFTLTMDLGNGYLPTGPMDASNCAAIQNKLQQEAASTSQVRPSVPTVQSCIVTGNQVDVLVVLSGGLCNTDQCSLQRGRNFVRRLLALAPFTLIFIRPDGSRGPFTVDIIRSSEVTLASPFFNPYQVFYALTSQNQIIRYNTLSPTVAESVVTINFPGQTTIDSITEIDFRPATGQLYGASSSNIYIINPNTGAARRVGGIPPPPSASVNYGTIVTIEFNPAKDALRVITTTSYDLQIDLVKGTYNPVLTSATDPAAGAAFSNNLAGASSSTLYIISPNTDVLTMQNPSSSQNNVQVGSGLGTDISAVCGFDISPEGLALACVKIGNTPYLYLVDVNTGILSQNLGPASQTITSLAMPTASVAYALQTGGTSLLIINANTINSQLSFIPRPITGLSSDTLVGLDMSPLNGQLFALGKGGVFYTIDSTTGAATSISSSVVPTTPSGTGFGFDFDPVSGNQIRVVNDGGLNQNFVYTGSSMTAGTSVAFNPVTLGITAAAYSNNYFGATTTVLYHIDSTTNQLLMQNPPNSGTLVPVGSLGITVDVNNGFDIGGTTGVARAALTVNGVTSIYQIDLSTGAAFLVPYSTLPSGVTGYTLGLGV